MSKRKACCIEGCDAPVVDAGCCENHKREWMRSPEFRAAADDHDVRFLRRMARFIRSGRSAPAQMMQRFSLEQVDTAMAEAGLCERDRMAVSVLLHTPLSPPLVVPVTKVREALMEALGLLYGCEVNPRSVLMEMRRLGVDLDAPSAKALPPTACGALVDGALCRRWDGHDGVCDPEGSR